MPDGRRLFTPRRPEHATFTGRAGIQRLSWHALIECEHPDAFQATLGAVVYDELALAWMRHTPAVQIRNQTMLDAMDIGSTVVMVNRGPFILRQGETTHRAEAGDVVVISGVAPFTVDSPQGMDAISITIAPVTFERFGTPPFEDATRVLPPNVLNAVLASVLRTTMAQPPRPASVEGMTTQRTLTQLLIGVLTVGFSSDAEETQPPNAALAARAMTFISEFAREPGLDVDGVAAGVGTSIRSLQRVFAEAGTTVTVEIRAQRLRIAMTSILDQAYRPADLATVAIMSGFATTTRLNRAFKSVHGGSIAAYRAAVLSTTAGALDRR